MTITIDLPIYNYKLFVFVGELLKNKLRVFKKHTTQETFNELKDALVLQGLTGGRLIRPGDSMTCFIILPQDPSAPVIAHEAVHASFGILCRIGVELNYSSEEALAYLTEYIVKQIHLKLNK